MVCVIEGVAAMTDIDITPAHTAQPRDGTPGLEQRVHQPRVFAARQLRVTGQPVASREQGALHEVHRIGLGVPVIPGKFARVRKPVQLIGQEADVRSCRFECRKLGFEAQRMEAIVVVPLTDEFASRALDGEIAQGPERASFGGSSHANAGIHRRHGAQPCVERRPAVVDDQQLPPRVGLPQKIADRELQQRLAAGLGDGDTADEHRVAGGVNNHEIVGNPVR